MIALICGGRTYQFTDADNTWLHAFHAAYPLTQILHGGATGADTDAEWWARRHSIPTDIYPADWQSQGRKAGPVRNTVMLDVLLDHARMGKPVCVIAFPGHSGTTDTIRKARGAGLTIYELTRGYPAMPTPTIPETPTPSDAELQIFGPSLLDPPPEDIADPAVPPAAIAETPQEVSPAMPDPDRALFNQHEALLHGFLQKMQTQLGGWLDERLKAQDIVQEQVMGAWKGWLATQASANEHAQYQWSDAVLKLQEHGLGSLGAPYSVTVQAMSPDGYSVTLEIRKQEAAALVEELERLLGWLAQHNYGAAELAWKQA